MTADIHTLTGAYALDALCNGERVAFEEHLDRCPACHKEVAELRETAARLSVAVATQPNPGLKPLVLERVRWVRQLPPDEGPIIPLRGRKWPLRVTAFAAAASVVGAAVLGVKVLHTTGELTQADQALTAVRGEQAALGEVLTAPDARIVNGVDKTVSATVVVSRERGKVAFIPRRMAELSQDRAYQLWLIGPKGPVSAGVMASDSSLVVADLGADTDTFGVTVEPRGGSRQPTTDPVMVLALA